MDFLTRSSIYYALTVSPIVSTSFVEQFWMTAKSRTVNNTSYIDVTIAGKPMTISEASIKSDLLFDDADGIDSLTSQAIFDNIQGKNFSGKVTPLFDSMLVQQTEDEGDASERPSDSPPIPSHPHPSEDQPQIQPDPSPRPSPTTHILDSIPEGSGGNHGGSCQEAKERSQTTYHTSQSLDEDKIGMENFSEEKVDVEDTLDYMETKDVQDERRNEGTDKGNKGTDKQDGGTDSIKVSTDRQGEGTTDQNEGKSATQTALTPTSTPTPTVFGDDKTIAQVLIIISQNKEKLK
ncbi:hypothetical protein Tco_1510086, partial [Tanacetum coccineum]